jgi:hypothetical protein
MAGQLDPQYAIGSRVIVLANDSVTGVVTGSTCEIPLTALAAAILAGFGLTIPVPIASGGTGQITASAAYIALGGGTLGQQNSNTVLITGGSLAGVTVAATTLSASGNDALMYQCSNAQSFASGTAATVTTWTQVFDRVNTNFVAATGIFTAPAAGIYHVAAQLTFASAANVVGTAVEATIVANGVAVATGATWEEATGTTANTVSVAADVSIAAGQTIVIQGFQNSGVARALSATALFNFLSIHRVP